MKTTFTPEYILTHRGCYSKEEASNLSFMRQEIITIEQIIDSELPLYDFGWFLIKKCELERTQKIHLAKSMAEIILPIFEAKIPGDNRPRKALEAIDSFLSGDMSHDDLIAARRAACAAAYAASACAAAARAAAADAADAAAYAYAADAAYAYSAAAAADAAEREKQKNLIRKWLG